MQNKINFRKSDRFLLPLAGTTILVKELNRNGHKRKWNYNIKTEKEKS
jgi:hypothetical protein